MGRDQGEVRSACQTCPKSDDKMFSESSGGVMHADVKIKGNPEM